MLSETKTEVLIFVAASIRKDGIVPTFREIADATGLSVSGARKTVMALEDLGFIERRYHKFRAIKVLRWPEEAKAA
jgi:repressor LexA